jgi:hypothetical protein
MNSLESKLDQLSPDKRKEVEDFVDFLLSRVGPLPVREVSPAAPPVLTPPPPVMTALEMHQDRGTPAVNVHDVPRTEDPRANPDPAGGPESPIREITAGGDDGITRDYMDYGQFERDQSPADEAVKKVKQKIARREQQDPSRQMLDWIE